LKKIKQLEPMEIEKRSFEIISHELSEMQITLPADQEMITKRVIHTSADFDYIQTLKYSKDAVAIAKRLISEGADIVTDTNMALSGINKKYLAKFGGQAHCFMADDEVALIAKEKKTTRAAVSMEFASRIDKPVIFAIGNAPTALIELYDMIEKGIYKPAFVIGVPVGFVNVVESKERLFAVCEKHGVPAIVAMGRKGGSNVAAAICNALIYSAAEMLDPSARGWK
jgi:precorrin-8X/cobalt-precorrin-8 methylmutase